MLRLVIPAALLLSGCGIKGKLATPPPLFGDAPAATDDAAPRDVPLSGAIPVVGDPDRPAPEGVGEGGLAPPAPYYGPDIDPDDD